MVILTSFSAPWFFRTWRCWNQSFVPELQKATQRTGRVAEVVTWPPPADPQVSADRNAAGICGRTLAWWRKTRVNWTPCSYDWTSPRKSCWKRGSKRDSPHCYSARYLWLMQTDSTQQFKNLFHILVCSLTSSARPVWICVIWARKVQQFFFFLNDWTDFSCQCLEFISVFIRRAGLV